MEMHRDSGGERAGRIRQGKGQIRALGLLKAISASVRPRGPLPVTGASCASSPSPYLATEQGSPAA